MKTKKKSEIEDDNSYSPIQQRLGELGVNDDIVKDKLSKAIALLEEKNTEIRLLSSDCESYRKAQEKLLKENRQLKKRIKDLEQAHISHRDTLNAIEVERYQKAHDLKWIEDFAKLAEFKTMQKPITSEFDPT